MVVENLLNPSSEIENRRFEILLELTRLQRQTQLANPSTATPLIYNGLSNNDNSLVASDDSDQDDTAILEGYGILAALMALSSSSGYRLSTPFLEKDIIAMEQGEYDTEEETNEEEEEESNEDEEVEEDSVSRKRTIHSISQSPKNTQEDLHKMKLERIMHKIDRVIRQLHLAKDVPPLEAILQEANLTLSTIPALKIRKRTVNQTTAVITFFALKKLKIEIPVSEVIAALKKIEKSHSLTRSAKPNYSRNNAEVLGISKLVSSLETITTNSSNSNNSNDPQRDVSPTPYSHAKSTAETTKKLCQDLGLGLEIEELACRYATLSEDSSLASRHNASVAASCVLLATKDMKKKLTLTKVSEISGVSGCTIRKAQKALSALLEKPHEE